MLLLAFFLDKGVPKTGLSPTIDVWEDDGTQVVTAQAMTEIAGGFYKYDFAGYDESKDYCIRADGGVALAVNDRYVFNTNEVGQVTEDLTDVKGTGFVKDTDSLRQVRPETDKISDVKTETDKIAAVKAQTDKIPKLLGLAFENYKLYDQAYDANKNLTSAKIRIYPTAADLEADTNKTAEYLISVTFSAGLCTLFKVKLV